MSEIHVADAGYLPSTRNIALALADRLTAYYTPYWVAAGDRIVNVPRLGRQFARRTLPVELLPVAQRVCTSAELSRVALYRAGARSLNYRLLWHRNTTFDRRVARRLPADATVVGQFGAALASFERVAGRGHTMLDYPIARLDHVQDFLVEEARLRPDFADSIITKDSLFNERAHLDRMAAETQIADAIVVGSQFVADSFAGHVEPARLHVVPYGCDTTRFHPRGGERAPGPLRVVFAGQVTQRKGIAYLLDAISSLDAKQVELTIVGPIVGSGSGLAPYAGRFRHVAGARPQDMPQVFREADVLALPSLMEGSAHVVYEALASGLPAIVTPNAGSIVRDGVEGFVVPVRDAAAIAERIDTLARDEALLARMSGASRARAEQYDVRTFLHKISALVDALDDRAEPGRRSPAEVFA